MGTINDMYMGLSHGAAKPSSLSSYLAPVQMQRIKVDVNGWRRCMSEAEYAYYPFRVRMQQMFIDTILNGHVASLMERRQDLTMLRKRKVVDATGVQSDDLTQYWQESEWVNDFIQYSLDAEFFGYSLIEFGDIINDEFKDLSIVRRWNVSPDRREATTFPYNPNGLKFDNDPYKNWHVFVKTRSENGVSPCGYGLFYKIAIYEIYLRNTLGYNGDFVELYSQPYRVGKTTKTTESERAELEAALQNMGSAGYAIIDPSDEIAFLETALGGTGYKGYESLESRCQKTVSKLILGHADAIDSTPGKLGSGQPSDGLAMDGSPVAMALGDKQTKDGRKIQGIINNQLNPNLKALGFKYALPDGYKFIFSNDAEVQETRKKEDDANLSTATIAQTMKTAGLKMDAAYFQERTGIPTTDAPEPEPAPVIKPGSKIANRLKNLYGKK
jgi:phage gp29-like protein